MSKNVIVRKPKKDVRRVEFQEVFPAHTTQADSIIHTAGQKETLMGFKIYVTVYTMAAMPAAAITKWVLYSADSGAVRTVNVSDILDGDVDKEKIAYRRDPMPDGGHIVTYSIESKAKRKLSKGDVLYLSAISNSIQGSMEHYIGGVLYIGE